MGQGIGGGVPQLGRLINRRAAGIGVAHRAGSLVERLPCRVVPGAADHPETGVVEHLDDVAVPAGRHHAEEGRSEFRVGDVVCRDMPPDMVDGDKGLSGGQGEALCVVDPHEQRPDQAGRVGDGDGVQAAKGQLRFAHRFLHDLADVLAVPPGGDLRHNAAVFAVLLHLGGNDGGEDLPPVYDHRGGSLVAGAFDCQYFHIFFQNDSPLQLDPH